MMSITAACVIHPSIFRHWLKKNKKKTLITNNPAHCNAIQCSAAWGLKALT